MGVCNSKCTSTDRLENKVAVITGCNTGIGKECAKDFYVRGAKVIMACRNLGKADEAIKDIKEECKNLTKLGSLQSIKLDLTNLKSVRECAQTIIESETKIDILLNNAGIMMCPEGKTADGFEMQFGTNHLGHFLFTMLLMPKIVSSNSNPARIVNVSSMGHISGTIKFEDLNWEKRKYSALNAYTQSKLANVLFTKELSKRLLDADVNHVNTYSLHPGVIRTELSRHVGETYFKAMGAMVDAYAYVAAKTPLQGAQTSIYCCVSEEAGKETGLYYQECKVARCSDKANNVQDAHQLWEESLKLTGLGNDFNPFTNST